MPSSYFNGMGDLILDTFQETVSALFKPQEGSIQPVEIIFNKAHQDIDIDGKPYGAPNPRAWIRTESICPVYGDVLEVDGEDYLVREIKPDGLELTALVLSEDIS